MFQTGKLLALTRKKKFGNYYISSLFIVTFLLIFLNKADYIIASKIKSVSIDVISPLSRVISIPITYTAQVIRNIDNLRFLHNQNLKLKEEIIRLKKWQTLAIKTNRENKAYKKLLKSTSNETKVIKTAYILSQSPGIYSKDIIINAGMFHGVSNNLAVINERGLLGKVVLSSKKNSKVLLITDQNSAVPVKSLTEDFYAIVKGSSKGNYLQSSFIKNEKKPKVGEILYTSGNTDLFPADLLVGRVIKVYEDSFLAIPYVDFEDIEFVQIVD